MEQSFTPTFGEHRRLGDLSVAKISVRRSRFQSIAALVCVLITSLCLVVVESTSETLAIPSWTTVDFYDAIDKNDAKRVRTYLADTKRATKKFLSYCLLDYALELKRDQIAMLMVEAGAGVNTLSAVQYENVQILEKMLKRRVEPQGASLVAELGNVHIVSLLLSHGEDDLSTEGAVLGGQLEALKLLLDHGAEPDGLEIAILYKRSAIGQLLLDSGADPNEITRLQLGDLWDADFPSDYWLEYLSPLHYAVLTKSLALVKALLNAGADPNVVPSAITLRKNRYASEAWPTLLQTAQDPKWGDATIAQLLEKNGANLTVADNDEDSQLELDLYTAAEKWDYEEVKRLLELGAVPTGFGNFYYDYSEHYDPKIMQAFVKAGADPNVYNEKYELIFYTPTALTLMNGDVENFRRFIQAGASTNEVLLRSYYKLALGSGLGDALEIIRSLGRERRCHLDLHIPVRHGIVHTVETILSKGARPVGLRTAVEVESVEIVKMLLEAGADPDQTDKPEEKSVFELAVEIGNQDIIGLLKQAKASK